MYGKLLLVYLKVVNHSCCILWLKYDAFQLQIWEHEKNKWKNMIFQYSLIIIEIKMQKSWKLVNTVNRGLKQNTRGYSLT